MFSKIEKTNFPPSEKPMMVWDGECGFCKYWITHWKSKTKDRIEYRKFQEVAHLYDDIPLKEFQKASRLIEPDGNIYSGPDSAYRSFTYFENSSSPTHSWYQENGWFTSFSDRTYNFIAKHRGFMLNVSKLLFGKDPVSMKPYWFILLLFAFCIAYLLLHFL